MCEAAGEGVKNQVVSVKYLRMFLIEQEIPGRNFLSGYGVRNQFLRAGKYLWTRTIITYTQTEVVQHRIQCQKMVMTVFQESPEIRGKMVLASKTSQSIISHLPKMPASQQVLMDGQPLCSRSHPKRSIFGVTKIHSYTNGTSINTTPVIIGVHGDNGADGNPTRSHRKRDRAR